MRRDEVKKLTPQEFLADEEYKDKNIWDLQYQSTSDEDDSRSEEEDEDEETSSDDEDERPMRENDKEVIFEKKVKG